MKRRTTRTRPACRKAGSALAKKSTKKPARRTAASKLRACRKNPSASPGTEAERAPRVYYVAVYETRPPRVRRKSVGLVAETLAEAKAEAFRTATDPNYSDYAEVIGLRRIMTGGAILAEWRHYPRSGTWRRVAVDHSLL